MKKQQPMSDMSPKPPLSNRTGMRDTSESLRALPTDLDAPRIPQQARSREKRARLLTAALELFEKHGYEDATIDAIAERAGVSIGVFYSYFRSKRQILLALALDRHESARFTLSALETEKPSAATIEGRLSAFLVESRQYAGLRRARQELALADPDFAARERQQQDVLCAQLAQNLEQARTLNLLREALDIPATAAVILGVAAQLRDWYFDRPDENLRPLIAAAAQMIYHALFADSASG